MDFSNNMNDVKISEMVLSATASPLDKLKQPESFVKEVDTLDKFSAPEPWGKENLTGGNEVENKKTPLSTETKESLSVLGYPEEIIDRIKSEEEANIYLEAGLEPKDVNDRPCLVKIDIDPDRKDPVTGETNLEKMKRGRAPLDENNKPIELHHIGQNNDSPLAELTRDEHTGKGNYAILHDKKESEIDRKGFEKEKSEHWKARAEQIKSQQS